MVDHAELVAVVHKSVSTSKDLAKTLQDEIANSTTGSVTLSTLKVQAIASQLRITANLVAGFLEENTTMLDRINTLVDRLPKE
jgi:hypothetical protein